LYLHLSKIRISPYVLIKLQQVRASLPAVLKTKKPSTQLRALIL
jgi:hypothetical protein